MRLVHYHDPGRGGVWGLCEADTIADIATDEGCRGAFLATLLQLPNPIAALKAAAGSTGRFTFSGLTSAAPDPGTPHLLAPIDLQEVWAAGVTYMRSRVARMEESEGAARFYDMIYEADRPELFFKATASRVSGPNGPVCIRRDAAWNVPEPEVGLVLTPSLKRIGYTLGNDMSSRDIEGANPLYLPQAKVYRNACGLGPAILLEESPQEHRELVVRIAIERAGATAFSGDITTAQMKRQFGELAQWLGRDNVFPHGAILLTGTGLVPESTFTLNAGDRVSITSPEIGTLANTVALAS
jgi:2-dehydro-3-deoxy-D-arabinonate dehydratase